MSKGLPTMDVLASKGLNVDRRCPRCGEAPEIVVHMTLLCKDAQVLWRISPVQL